MLYQDKVWKQENLQGRPCSDKGGDYMETDLSVSLAGLTLDNPIIPASGTFGYGQEFLDAIKNFTKGGKLILEKAELEVDSADAEPDIHSADEFEADDLGGVVARTWRRGVMDPDLIKG